jgi:hypothetical protein
MAQCVTAATAMMAARQRRPPQRRHSNGHDDRDVAAKTVDTRKGDRGNGLNGSTTMAADSRDGGDDLVTVSCSVSSKSCYGCRWLRLFGSRQPQWLR